MQQKKHNMTPFNCSTRRQATRRRILVHYITDGQNEKELTNDKAGSRSCTPNDVRTQAHIMADVKYLGHN
jgi:hypothetical protein